MASLARIEESAEAGQIDVFYGDESGVCLIPCVPSGWQFGDEDLFIPSTSGKAVNCFALLSRDNRCFFRTTEQTINAALIRDYLDDFSRHLERPTVVVLDNAPVHQSEVRKCRAASKIAAICRAWEAKGMYVFFLPPRYFAEQKPVLAATEHRGDTVAQAQDREMP